MNKMMKTTVKLLTLFFTILYTQISIAQTTTLPFEYYQRLIFLKVKVNQTEDLLFLLDTGANASAIDSKTNEKLGLETVKVDSVQGSAGTIVVPFVKAKSVSVGDKMVQDLTFSNYDLSGSLSLPNQHLDGILGTDFLKHFVVSIDFSNQLISFSSKVENKLAHSFPFEMENGIPRIKAKINDQVETYFRYDSGSSLFETEDIYLNTTLPVLEILKKSDENMKPVSYLSASGVGGSIRLEVYKANTVSMGQLNIQQPYIIVQPKQGYFALPEAVGFCGNNLFEKFQKITIDFINKNFYVGENISNDNLSVN